MKFLADMGISLKTVQRLRELNFDLYHLIEQNFHKMPDSKIYELATREERIILTHDLDFSDIVAASGEQLPSVIIFRLENMKSINVNIVLEFIIQRHSEELEKGAIISVNESNIRVRMLPI